MQAKIKDGNIVITVPIEQASISASGKMSLVSKGGWKDLGVKHEGHELRANLTIGYYNDRAPG